MATARHRRVVGAAMIAVGLVQASVGSLDGDHVFALLGVVYAGIGVAYLRFKGYATRQ
jgi:energy-converting hydrogenase Eha subunit E